MRSLQRRSAEQLNTPQGLATKLKSPRESLLLIAVPLVVLTGAMAWLLPSNETAEVLTEVKLSQPDVEIVAPLQPVVARKAVQVLALEDAAVQHAVATDLIHGDVTDTLGQPVPGAIVRVTARPNMLDGQGQALLPMEAASVINSDALGRFSFKHVGAVLYDLMVSAAGFAPETFTFQHGMHCAAVLTAPASVHGTVRDEAGQCVDGVLLQLVQGAHRESVLADAGGNFRFSQVGAGAALLEVSHHQFEPQLVRIPAILEGEQVQRNITVLAGTTLVGRVVLPNGRAVANTAVIVQDLSRMLPCGTVHTDSNGLFQLRAMNPGSRYRICAQNANGAASIAMEFPSVGPAPLVELHLEPRWNLAGFVTTLQGVAIEGASVTLVAENGAGLCAVVSDGSGAFRVEGLVTGMNYRLVAVAPGLAVRQISGVSHNKPVVDVAMEPGASADGRVMALHGVPLQGAAVKLTFPSNPMAPIFVLTGPDGRWHLDMLPSGDAWLTVMRSGYQNEICSIELAAPARVGLIQTTLVPLN